MSHYSVAVFTRTNSDEAVDFLLVPFDENTSVRPYIASTMDKMIKDEQKQYENLFKSKKYHNYLENPDSIDANSALYFKQAEEESKPGGIRLIEKRLSKLYGKDDKIIDLVDIDRDYMDCDGNYWSCYNPDSKWDWYQEGGRFEGTLVLKNGMPVNAAFMQDLKFELSAEQTKNSRNFWNDYVLGEEKDMSIISRKYGIFLSSPEYYLNRYETIEKYLESQAKFETYACVTPDGKWHEPGRMGWFGISMAEDDVQSQWQKEYDEIFEKALTENWYVTIIDCHI